jgi:hypothetical protein
MNPAIAYFENSGQIELKKQGDRREIGVVGLEEALVIFQRLLSNSGLNPETTDEFAQAWSIGFFRSAEEFVDCSVDPSRNVDVRWGTSVDGVPWLLRPYCGSLEVEIPHAPPVDAETRIRQFFTSSADQLRAAIRADIRKKDGPRWIMWSGRAAIYLYVAYISIESAINRNNPRGIYLVLILVAISILPAFWLPRRCSNCKTTVYERRLRLDGRCHRCDMIISLSEKEFSTTQSELTDY